MKRKIDRFRFLTANTVDNEKRKNSPILKKRFKKVEPTLDEEISNESDNSSTASKSDSNSNTPVSDQSTSTGFETESESEIEQFRQADCQINSPEISGSAATVPLSPEINSCNHFLTPQKQINSDSVYSPLPKRPTKSKNSLNENNTQSKSSATTLVVSYNDFLSGISGEPKTSTPIIEGNCQKLFSDLSDVPKMDGVTVNDPETPINVEQCLQESNQRILEELPDKYPICPLETLKRLKPLPSMMRIRKDQVQFLRSNNKS